MLTRDEVIWGYRYVLGREPESEDVILLYSGFSDRRAFREELLTSLEFQRQRNTQSPTWVAASVFNGERLMWLNLADRYVSANCLRDDYEPLESSFIRENLRPGHIFLDIGANIGWFTLLASTIIGPNGRIHAFEPRSDIFSHLTNTIEINNLGATVSLYPFALGDSANSVRLAWDPDSNNLGGSFVASGEIPDSFISESINLRRMDDLRIPNVDMIKMDVEGAEMLVLKGAQQTFERCRPIVLSEVTPVSLEAVSGVDVDEFFDFFGSRDYRGFIIDPVRFGEPVASFPRGWHKELVNIAFIPTEKLENGQARVSAG